MPCQLWLRIVSPDPSRCSWSGSYASGLIPEVPAGLTPFAAGEVVRALTDQVSGSTFAGNLSLTEPTTAHIEHHATNPWHFGSRTIRLLP